MPKTNNRTDRWQWVEAVIDVIKHGDLPQRLVWMLYFACKQRLMVGKVRRREVDKVEH